MAKVPTQAPSEDEDFDITTGNAVADEPAFEEPADPATAAAVETPEDDSPAEVNPEESDNEADTDEPSSEAPAEAAAVTTPGASPKVSKTSTLTRKAGAYKPSNPLAILRFAAEAALVIAVIVLAISVINLRADKHTLAGQLATATANPQALVQKQTNDLIATVSQLMQLPTGETPTVAEVSDAAAAKQQSAFFNNAQNGDKVLLYTKAGEAILYRPSTNKIILVAPLTFSNSTKGTTTKP